MRTLLIASLLCLSVSLSAQIAVNTNFEIISNQPIDTRDTLTTLADTAFVDWTFAGLLTYATDVDQYWYYNGSFWRRIGALIEGGQAITMSGDTVHLGGVFDNEILINSLTSDSFNITTDGFVELDVNGLRVHDGASTGSIFFDPNSTINTKITTSGGLNLHTTGGGGAKINFYRGATKFGNMNEDDGLRIDRITSYSTTGPPELLLYGWNTISGPGGRVTLHGGSGSASNANAGNVSLVGGHVDTSFQVDYSGVPGAVVIWSYSDTTVSGVVPALYTSAVFPGGVYAGMVSLSGSHSPTADVDIAGDLRIRENPVELRAYVVMSDADGYISMIDTATFFALTGGGAADGNGIISALPSGNVNIDANQNDLVIDSMNNMLLQATFGIDTIIGLAFAPSAGGVELGVSGGGNFSGMGISTTTVTFEADTLDATGVITFIGFPAGADGNGIFDAVNNLDTVMVDTILVNDYFTFLSENNAVVYFIGSSGDPLVHAINSGAGVAITGQSNDASGTGLAGINTSTGNAITALSADGNGIQSVTNGTAADYTLVGIKTTVDSTGYSGLINLQRNTSGTAGNGIGGSIEFEAKTNNGTTVDQGFIGMKWSNSVTASRTAAFETWLVNNAGAVARKSSLAGSGQLTLDGYSTNSFIGTGWGNLVVDASGVIYVDTSTVTGGSTPSIRNDLPTESITIDPNNFDLQIGTNALNNSGEFEFWTLTADTQDAILFAGSRDSSGLVGSGDSFAADVLMGSFGAEDGIAMINYDFLGTVYNFAVFGDSMFIGDYPGSSLNLFIDDLPRAPADTLSLVMVQNWTTKQVYGRNASTIGMQTLSASNDTLTISGGNSLKLPITELTIDSITGATITINLETRYQKIVQLDMTSATSVTLTVNNPMNAGVYTFHFLGVSGTDNVTWPASFYDANNVALGTDALTAGVMYTCYYSSSDAKYFCK